jgi:hypothetical protein
MATIYCTECEEGNPCPNQHLYVIQLREEIAENYAIKSKKGYLYVGSTSTSVEKRGRQNFMLEDGTYVEPSEVYEDRKLPAEEQQWSEDRDWKYKSKSIPKIRSFFQEYRPDLVLYDNPIMYDKNDQGKLERLEGKLADKLRNRGWRVINNVSWKSNKE